MGVSFSPNTLLFAWPDVKILCFFYLRCLFQLLYLTIRTHWASRNSVYVYDMIIIVHYKLFSNSIVQSFFAFVKFFDCFIILFGQIVACCCTASAIYSSFVIE